MRDRDTRRGVRRFVRPQARVWRMCLCHLQAAAPRRAERLDIDAADQPRDHKVPESPEDAR